MDGFLKHVSTGTNYATGQTGTPTDFLSFHAKGRPSFVGGHVRMGIATHLREADGGFTKVLSVPALAGKPVVIGESDPEGCAACPGPQNAYRNGTMYSSYTAASFARLWELARKRHVNLEGAVSWSFEFEDQPWFAGYRQLATNGVDLPVLNVFRLFARLGTTQLAATSDAQVPLDTVMAKGVQGEADVGSIATRTADGKLALLLWHYHDDDVAGPDAQISISLKGLKAKPATAALWRVDKTHANAFAAWQAMGSPQSPDQNQYAQLEKASQLQAETVSVTSGKASACPAASGCGAAGAELMQDRLRSGRWAIAAMIAVAIAISYLDRQTLPWAIKHIEADIPIGNQTKAFLDSAFLATYGLMYLGGGWLLDRVGTRIGFLAIMLFWSLACASHGLAGGIAALATSRLLLGMGEGGSFPAATRAIAEWFAPAQRAAAMGLVNAGTAVGAVLAPPLIAGILAHGGWLGLAGWRWVFS
jgi:hypothetical protein